MKVTDSDGKVYCLGEEVGHGGEGVVYQLIGNPNLVAKVYHQLPSSEIKEKLLAMVSMGTEELYSVCAWPVKLLFRDQSFIGFLCKKIGNSIEIHQLYNPKERKITFPKVSFAFLVHTACNLARAFQVLHKHNVIVGDVNDRNLLISSRSIVNFIDCDSFQVKNQDKTFCCAVGMAMYLPPEMQNRQISIQRSEMSDLFGLAVFLFQLLFMGRHPFSGSYAGDKEILLSEAIQKGYFCYSEAVTLPRHALPFSIIPETMQAYFLRALTGKNRPSALEWALELEKFQRSFKNCSNQHVYFSENLNCPFCRVEKDFGIYYFQSVDDQVMSDEICVLWKKITEVQNPGVLPKLILKLEKPDPDPIPVCRGVSNLCAIPLTFVAFFYFPALWILVLLSAFFSEEILLKIKILSKIYKKKKELKKWHLFFDKKKEEWASEGANQPFRALYLRLLSCKNEVVQLERLGEEKGRKRLLKRLEEGYFELLTLSQTIHKKRERISGEIEVIAKKIYQEEVNLSSLTCLN